MAVRRPSIPLAPTRILFCVLFLRKRLTRPHGNWIESQRVSKDTGYKLLEVAAMRKRRRDADSTRNASDRLVRAPRKLIMQHLTYLRRDLPRTASVDISK